MNISTKLVYQYMAIFLYFSPTSNHLYPLQVENCDRNSRFVVDEDDNGKFRLERVKHQDCKMSFEVVGHVRETQFQVSENLYYLKRYFKGKC